MRIFSSNSGFIRIQPKYSPDKRARPVETRHCRTARNIDPVKSGYRKLAVQKSWRLAG